MRATADITFSLLTSGFVLSPSLFFPWIQFVLSVQFVLQIRLLLDQSWLATLRDVSSGTHHMIKSVQAFSLLFVLQATKAGHGGMGTRLGVRLEWLASGVGSIRLAQLVPLPPQSMKLLATPKLIYTRRCEIDAWQTHSRDY